MPVSPRRRAGSLLLAGSTLIILLSAGGPALAACGDGTLDPGEQCDDGNVLNGDCCSAGCLIEPAGTVCRAAAGLCDAAEVCDGSRPMCPADVVAPSDTLCRPSAGGCDLPELCDGSSRSCPPDALVPAGAVCRAAASDCDLAETCNGISAACPPDASQPDGSLCNDGHACTDPDVCEAGTCTTTLRVESCADDFLRYRTRPVTGFTAVTGVELRDEFEDVLVDVIKGKGLATPAEKDGQQQLDPRTDLGSYVLRSGTPAVRQKGVLVENEIGSLVVDTMKADVLLVPTATSLTVQPPPPDGNNVDRYKCYRVRVGAGTMPFTPVRVSLSDQFTTTAKNFELRKPQHLCNPVELDGQAIKNPDAHLLCYLAKASPGEPRFTPVTRVQTNNEFGAAVLNVVRELELCVPSITSRGARSGA